MKKYKGIIIFYLVIAIGTIIIINDVDKSKGKDNDGCHYNCKVKQWK